MGAYADIMGNDGIEDPNDMKEIEIRRKYIDKALEDSHWKIGIDCKIEYAVCGITSPTGNGFADYVLLVDEKPLAVVEAKRASINPEAGGIQANEYANAIEKATGIRPTVFLANGKRILIDDHTYPPREVSGFYSPEDLRKLHQIRKNRDAQFGSSRPVGDKSLISVKPPEYIKERLYQQMALNHAITAFANKRRRALIVMATGSGKTRVVNAISEILIKYNWARNILFLVDRKELVEQAGDSYSDNLPTESLSLIYGNNHDKNFNVRIMVSCYPSMMIAIDNEKVNGKIRFTPGYFDLIVIDEAHRSVYESYKDILLHFDALFIGLTATPKDSIDRDTFELFEIVDKRPTFEYTLQEGVSDGYLCPPKLIKPRTSILTGGADYRKLNEKERKEYEKAFTETDGSMEISKEASKFYTRIYNKDTMKIVFRQLMENGLHINNGETLGKTIIFAPSHNYAEMILKTFWELYPDIYEYNPDYCRIIDYQTCGHGGDGGLNKSIKDFKNNKNFRIAISVDMLTTGVDIKEILNMVFYRKVGSKVLLMQMVGRGTRTCKGLMDGEDKKFFYIFDYCNNDFTGESLLDDSNTNKSLTERIFKLKIEIIRELQDGKYSGDEYQKMREGLIDSVMNDISTINRENFVVKDHHLLYVDRYSSRQMFECLDDEKVVELIGHIGPVIPTYKTEVTAERFDAMMYIMEKCALLGFQNASCIRDLKNKAASLMHDASTIKEVKEKLPIIRGILEDDNIREWGVFRLESIRIELRDLMQYVSKESRWYVSDLTDTFIGSTEEDLDLSLFGTENYRTKVHTLIDKYSGCEAIRKIHMNEQLTDDDIKELESILFKEAGGDRESFREAFGGMSLTEVVRRRVGLDASVVDEAFSNFILKHDLTDEMYYFVTTIMRKLKENGVLPKEKIIEPPIATGMDYLKKTFREHLPDYLNEIGGILDVFNQRAGAKC